MSHDHHHHHDHDHHHDHSHAHGASGGDLAHHDVEDIICLQNVGYRFPGHANDGTAGGGAVALRDVTLHVNRGENLGIIGPNGAGKTTLLRIMLGLLEGYTGTVRIMGRSPKQACAKGNIIGYVPQRADVEWRFPVTAEQVVLMGLAGGTRRFLPWYSKEERQRAGAMLARTGMTELKDRPIGQLSGGQQQRVFIARALVAQPPILILDEPLVGVDESGQQQFARFIHELHESLKLTVIIVSHDLQAIAAGCNRVACLKQTIHYHDAPAGLTREVLSEVFAHEIAPVLRNGGRA
jgi:ABC-type Mn2+/Zn2+ transport system ATPase subunit